MSYKIYHFVRYPNDLKICKILGPRVIPSYISENFLPVIKLTHSKNSEVVHSCSFKRSRTSLPCIVRSLINKPSEEVVSNINLTFFDFVRYLKAFFKYCMGIGSKFNTRRIKEDCTKTPFMLLNCC
eukprot:NODE_625_length_5289_cov_0.416956.p7 type:complete len:126 gc:universal NODE_625_length_5289_cov_0.416956:3768-3391(-)